MEETIINGHKVQFDEETHTYLVDGIVVPSVTQIIKRKFPSKYDGIDKNTLEKAGRLGTHLHEVLEIYEKTGKEIEWKNFDKFGDEDYSTKQELQNYKILKRLYGFEVIDTEKIIIIEYKGTIICAGKLDQIITLPNENGEMEDLYINDFKRTSSLDKDWLSWQETIYAIGYEQSYNKIIKGLRGTHLRNDKMKFVEINRINEQCYELFEEIYNEQKNNLFEL